MSKLSVEGALVRRVVVDPITSRKIGRRGGGSRFHDDYRLAAHGGEAELHRDIGESGLPCLVREDHDREASRSDQLEDSFEKVLAASRATGIDETDIMTLESPPERLVHFDVYARWISELPHHEGSSRQQLFRRDFENRFRQRREDERQSLFPLGQVGNAFIRPIGFLLFNDPTGSCVDLDVMLCHRVLNLGAILDRTLAKLASCIPGHLVARSDRS